MATFGDIENPDIEMIDTALDEKLMLYEEFLRKHAKDINFRKDGFLTLTPDKPNTARTTVTVNLKDPLTSKDNVSATMYAILFLPGDGTGDDKTYKPHDLEKPVYLQSAEPTRILPRKKQCAMEVFFPFFSIVNDTVYENLVYLEELTARDGHIVRACNLGTGVPKKEWTGKGYAADIIKRPDPYLQLTTGFTRYGKRFGDPHAIYHNKEVGAMQMVGFLSLDLDKKELCDVFEPIASVPEGLQSFS